MVESTPKVEKDVSGPALNVVRDVLNASDVVRSLSSLRIVLNRDVIWVGVVEGIEGGVEISDVLFGPLGFY
jgi:hypothetical protein